MHARLIARSEDRGGCSVIGAPALGGPRRQKRLVEVGRRWGRLEGYGLGREGAIDREEARHNPCPGSRWNTRDRKASPCDGACKLRPSYWSTSRGSIADATL